VDCSHLGTFVSSSTWHRTAWPVFDDRAPPFMMQPHTKFSELGPLGDLIKCSTHTTRHVAT
jgi:hypothetical protein